MTDETTFREPKDPANRDPLTGTPGAHPVGVGVGVGAASGGVAGAAVGAIGGPVSGAVGAGLGAVVGGLAGKAAAESVNPTDEDVYRRENHSRTAYAEPGRPYSDYEPAYRFGWERAARCAGRTFDEMHDALAVARGSPERAEVTVRTEAVCGREPVVAADAARQHIGLGRYSALPPDVRVLVSDKGVHGLGRDGPYGEFTRACPALSPRSGLAPWPCRNTRIRRSRWAKGSPRSGRGG